MEEENLNALQIENLCVDLGGFRLDNITLNIKRGAITGLIGANGAGKSTLIKTIMRGLDAQSGSILYNGIRYKGNEKKVLRSVACVFDEAVFSDNTKPGYLAKIYSKLYPTFDLKKFEELMNKFNLPVKKKYSKYSLGMKKKLLLILELCRNPEILILDEPTSAVDPYDRNEILTLIQEYMLDENHSVLFSTHITEDLDKIADYLITLDRGHKVIDADKEKLMDTYVIVRTTEMDEELQACAIGVVKDVFGYTFLSKNKALKDRDGLQVHTATIGEIFVHLLGLQKQTQNSSEDIFGI